MDVQTKLDESESERLKLSARFEQARLIARRYRMKFQNLEKEVEELKTKPAEKSMVEEENTTETARLKQELLALRAEIEKQKQQVSFSHAPDCMTCRISNFNFQLLF